MNNKIQFNKDTSLKSKEELEQERKNKIFVNGMIKRMSQDKYI